MSLDPDSWSHTFFSDLDPGSPNVADPTDPDPNHCMHPWYYLLISAINIRAMIVINIKSGFFISPIIPRSDPKTTNWSITSGLTFRIFYIIGYLCFHWFKTQISLKNLFFISYSKVQSLSYALTARSTAIDYRLYHCLFCFKILKDKDFERKIGTLILYFERLSTYF